MITHVRQNTILTLIAVIFIAAGAAVSLYDDQQEGTKLTILHSILWQG